MTTFKPPIIIALGGKAKHGKTTLSRDLQNAIRCAGQTCEITSFATGPKRMLKAFGLTDEQLYGNEKELPTGLLEGHTPRYAMQSLATEWGRQMLYNDIWIDNWERHINTLAVDYILVDDLRHLPELQRLRELQAIIFEVYRPSQMPQNLIQKIKHWVRQLSAHSSERLDFKKHGVKRLVVEEDEPLETLKKLMAEIRQMQ